MQKSEITEISRLQNNWLSGAASTLENVNLRAKGNNAELLNERLRGRKNYNVAIIALARKLICLIRHLLVNQEMYQEDDCDKNKREQKQASCDQVSLSSPEERLGDKVAAIVDAFYYLNARNRMDHLKDKLGDLTASESAPRRPFDGGG